MDCLQPVILKNGLAVPCGKCDICRSNIRNEWSIRLAIHLMQCDRMPLFITLTYDDMNLPWQCDSDIPDAVFPTLCRDDVSSFLKAYKRKYGLSNVKFQYFGCGEYGENYRRPHYHLLYFGDDELYNDFFLDESVARSRICSVWGKGFVHIGVAGFDGIHYVTKYCLKDDLEWLPECVVKPFTIASKGLGMNFLKTPQADEIRRKLITLHYHQKEIIASLPDFGDLRTIKQTLEALSKHLPDFRVILDDGRKVFLPRSIRRKLTGSFEHFKDSPLWFAQSLKTLADSLQYYADYGAYDTLHDENMSMTKLRTRLEKIHKRYLENKFNKHIKPL